MLYGELKRSRGRPSRTAHLFRVVGEKLPFEALTEVRLQLRDSGHPHHGVHVAHDSMGCPRYIGRGDIFLRLEARFRVQPLELKYFSFYVVSEKKHEREIETLLIRAAGFLLEFNDRKKRVGIDHGTSEISKRALCSSNASRRRKERPTSPQERRRGDRPSAKRESGGKKESPRP